MKRTLVSFTVVAAAAALATLLSAQTPTTKGRQFLKAVGGFTPADFAALDAGKPVTRQLETKEKAEVATVGAIAVKADPLALYEASRDMAKLRRVPEILEIGVFSDPPRVEDLSLLNFSDDDYDAIRRCRPGKCDIKLGAVAIDRLVKDIDWSAPNARQKASALAKEQLVSYVKSYQAGGTAAMGTILDKASARSRVDEFGALLANSPYFLEYVPDFYAYLRDYPKGMPPRTHDVFYWTRDNFGLKPTISVFHVTVQSREGNRALLAQKLIYASHYFNAGLETWAVTESPSGQGFELIMIYRTRLDPPTGMLAGVLMGKIKGGVETGVRENLLAAKSKAEAH